MIDGVVIKKLAQFHDERGKVMRLLDSSSENFAAINEVYFSCIYANAIKGWHRHKMMTLNYASIFGSVKCVLFDDRDNSPTKGVIQEIFLSPENYCLVSVPPKIWNGFKGLGTDMSTVVNCTSMIHEDDEVDKKDPFDNDIPYDWGINHR